MPHAAVPSDGSILLLHQPHVETPINESADQSIPGNNEPLMTNIFVPVGPTLLEQAQPQHSCCQRHCQSTQSCLQKCNHPEPSRCSELLEMLEAAGTQRTTALQLIKGRIPHLAFDGAGCRLVQAALKCSSVSTATKIARELHTHICMAATCQHGNFVVQRIVEVLPASLSGFVVDELSDAVLEMACHRFACRIICRLLEHCLSTPKTRDMMDKLLRDVDVLCNNRYGHFVLEVALEHGSPENRTVIATALLQNLAYLARQRSASHVLVNALRFCCYVDCAALVNGFVKGGQLGVLAIHKYGHKVVCALLELPQEQMRQVVNQLLPEMLRLQKWKYGKRVVEQLTCQQIPSALIP